MFENEISHESGVELILNAYKKSAFPIEIEGVQGALHSILIALLYRIKNAPFLVVVPTEREASALAADLSVLGIRSEIFPWWGTLPYRPASPLSPVFAERTKVLSALAAGNNTAVVIACERSFLSPLPPPEYIKTLLSPIKKGAQLDTAALAEKLISFGYTRVPRVQMSGEFVLRGEVFDVFLGGENYAYRILLDFDRVESIRAFDIETQSFIHDGKTNSVDEILIHPVKEIVWTDDRIDALSESLLHAQEFRDNGKFVLENLMSRKNCPGEELFFPLAFESAASLIDYFPRDKSVFVFLERERLENAIESLERENSSLYRMSLRDNPEFEVPAPERILLNFYDLLSRVQNAVSFFSMRANTLFKKENIPDTNIHAHSASLPPLPVPHHINCDPPRTFFGNISYMKDEFVNLLSQSWHIIVACESETQTERIKEILKDIPGDDGLQAGISPAFPQKETGGRAPGVKNGKVFAKNGSHTLPLDVVYAPLSAGFGLPEIKLLVVQEAEIFGRRARPPRSLKTTRSAAIDSFVELNPGDFIVHINYGIGLFKGIERIRALGNERDYIKLEYADDETIFVPIEQVNLVQRYIGNEGSSPRLDKIGSKSWDGRKERVKKAVEELAARLIVLYSKRKAARGYAFARDGEWQTMFEASFPYDETVDQLRCVEEIKADMEKPVPMDRLVCGDVGYGKTEVALRACFKAIMGGKQVAFLAPTTILVEQHCENFKERFSRFPVRIAMLSRFVDGKTTRKTIEQVKAGEIDILIGTHRIIQKDMAFKDLGLLVIDEEQRFGVKDKERLKEMKYNVDCLSLSATPIPRTLHMSLLKIRDMSLLTTPPRNRHPIETFIDEYNEEKIAKAIRAEVARGGQVFFLHNKIESLQEIRFRIERLVPEMLIETAHGQMDSHELEDVMHRFIHGGFHVLVSTTIIENGIDIPNVNTIIIDRADMYGISQLYQLRGRVGRSERTACAYLFYPHDKAISELAMKRLQAVSDFTELGSGFKIAMKDMEIRGAGNLLGREQSGDIYSVGFDMYLRLLDSAVQKLQNEDYESETETLLELEYSGFIPDSYIAGAQEKMEMYKKIASVRAKEELESVYSEMYERFGPPPPSAASLLSLAEIKIICRELSVSSLKERKGIVRIEFTKVAKIKIERLLRMVKESGGKVKLDPAAPNVIILQTGAIGLKEKSEFIREKLAALQ
ncbi:MAG: transcription-repair coupling factor [Spirochaetaceae bacterium]|jgi:transcription-repair coupling factor (superfamily II helicase)|nr:transcription-repair coupling factor [Spirochaetaceae bacterium]